MNHRKEIDMDYNKYENRLEFPAAVKYYTCSKCGKLFCKSDSFCSKCGNNVKNESEKATVEYKEKRKVYSVEEQRLYLLFKEDAIREAGFENSPFKDKAFSYAWENSHSYGYSEVFDTLVDLAERVLL